MRRSFAYKSIAIVLANLLLVSSLSYSINLHLCQDSIKHLSLFGPAERCSELETTISCHHHPDHDNTDGSVEQKKCCADQSLLVETDHEYSVSQALQDLATISAAVDISTKSYDDLIDWNDHSAFLCYKPPRLIFDLPVLLQEFLI